jgi:hypothetical protein
MIQDVSFSPENLAQDLAVEYITLCAKIDGALKSGEVSSLHLRGTAQKFCSSPDMPIFSTLPTATCGSLWRLALAQVLLQNCQEEIQELTATSDGPSLSSLEECSMSEFTDASASLCGDSPKASLGETLLQGAHLLQSSVSKDVDEWSMRKHLQNLQNEDQRCILLLRDIQRLGFSPKALLTSHFSQFGPVKQIMIARSATNGARKRSRVRPAGLGFVVMGNAEAAAAVQHKGERQVILGTTSEVRIRCFKHTNSDQAGCLKSSTWADISGF